MPQFLDLKFLKNESFTRFFNFQNSVSLKYLFKKDLGTIFKKVCLVINGIDQIFLKNCFGSKLTFYEDEVCQLVDIDR